MAIVESVELQLKLNIDNFNRQFLQVKKELSKTLIIPTQVDTSQINQELQTLSQKLRPIKVDLTPDVDDFNKKLQKLGNLAPEIKVKVTPDFSDFQSIKMPEIRITPTVDHKPLTELNKHLDKKKKHVKELQQYFNSNPLKIATVVGGKTTNNSNNTTSSSSSTSSESNIFLSQIAENTENIESLVREIKSVLFASPLGMGAMPGAGFNPNISPLVQALQPFKSFGSVILKMITMSAGMNALKTYGVPLLAGAIDKVKQLKSGAVSVGQTALALKPGMPNLPQLPGISLGQVIRQKALPPVGGLVSRTTEKGGAIAKDLDLQLGKAIIIAQKIKQEMGMISIGIGMEIRNGLKKGLSENAIKEIAENIGWVIITSVEEVLGIASASKEFKKIGGFILEGLEKGLSNLDQVTVPFKADIQKFAKEIKTSVKEASEQGGRFENLEMGIKASIPNPNVIPKAQNIAQYGYQMLASEPQKFAAKKTAKIQTPEFEKTFQTLVSQYSEGLDEINDRVIVGINGLAEDSREAQQKLDNWLKQTFTQAQVFTEELEASNLSKEAQNNPVLAASETIDNFNKFYVEGEINPDALKMAARILAIAQKNPKAKIQALGRGVGGNVVQEALFILEQAGYGNVIANVKGTGLGTVKAAAPYAPQNFEAVIPNSSALKMIGITEQGDFSPHKLITENLVKAAVVRPVVAAVSAAVPPIGAYRMAVAPFGTARSYAKAATGGFGEEEQIAKIQENLGIETQGITGFFNTFKAYVASEDLLNQERVKAFEGAKEKIAAGYGELENIQTAGIGSVFQWAKGMGTRIAALGGVIGSAIAGWTFLITLPDQIEALGLIFAKQLDGIYRGIQALSTDVNVFDKLESSSQKFGVSLLSAATAYKDFLTLTKSGIVTETRASEMQQGLMEIMGNRNIAIPQQAQVYQAFTNLLGQKQLTAEDFNQIENILPGAVGSAETALGMNIQEMQDAFNSGQLTASDALPKLIEQMRIESKAFEALITDSAVAADARLMAQTEIFQKQVGTAGLPVYTMLTDLQTTGLKVVGSILQGLGKIYDYLATFFFVMLGKKALEFGSLLQAKLADPKLLGVNLFDKIYNSITVTSPRLNSFATALGRITLGLKNLIVANAPILAIAAAVQFATNAFQAWNAQSERTKGILAQMDEAYRVNNESLTEQNNIFDKTLEYLGKLLTFQQTLGNINPFGDNNILNKGIKTISQWGELLSGKQVTGSFTNLEGKTGLNKQLSLREVQEMRRYQEDIVSIQNRFNKLQNTEKIFNISPDQFSQALQGVKAIDEEITVAKVKLSNLRIEGDYEGAAEVKNQLDELTRRRTIIIDTQLGSIVPLQVALKGIEELKSEYAGIFAGAGMTETDFMKLMQDPQKNKESLAPLEPLIAAKGFKSLDDFYTFLTNINNQYEKGQKEVDKYNEALRGSIDNFRKLAAEFQKISAQRATQFFQSEINQLKNLNNIKRQQLEGLTSGKFSESRANYESSRIQLDSLKAQEQAIKQQLNSLFQTILSASSANIQGLKELLGINGDLFSELKNMSPEEIQAKIDIYKSTLGENEQLSPILERLAQEAANYLNVQKDLLDVNNQVVESEIALKQAREEMSLSRIERETNNARSSLTISSNREITSTRRQLLENQNTTNEQVDLNVANLEAEKAQKELNIIRKQLRELTRAFRRGDISKRTFEDQSRDLKTQISEQEANIAQSEISARDALKNYYQSEMTAAQSQFESTSGINAAKAKLAGGNAAEIEKNKIIDSITLIKTQISWQDFLYQQGLINARDYQSERAKLEQQLYDQYVALMDAKLQIEITQINQRIAIEGKYYELLEKEFDVASRRLDIEKQIIESRQKLDQAFSNQEITGLESQLASVQKQVELFSAIRSNQNIFTNDQRGGAVGDAISNYEQVIARQLGVDAGYLVSIKNDAVKLTELELQYLDQQFALENEIADKKLNALKLEQEYQDKLLKIDLERTRLQSQQAIYSAMRNQLSAQGEVEVARKELDKSQFIENPIERAAFDEEARNKLTLAEMGLDIASQELQMARESAAAQDELAKNAIAAQEAQQSAALSQEDAAKQARLQAQELERARRAVEGMTAGQGEGQGNESQQGANRRPGRTRRISGYKAGLSSEQEQAIFSYQQNRRIKDTFNTNSEAYNRIAELSRTANYGGTWNQQVTDNLNSNFDRLNNNLENVASRPTNLYVSSSNPTSDAAQIYNELGQSASRGANL